MVCDIAYCSILLPSVASNPRLSWASPSATFPTTSALSLARLPFQHPQMSISLCVVQEAKTAVHFWISRWLPHSCFRQCHWGLGWATLSSHSSLNSPGCGTWIRSSAAFTSHFKKRERTSSQGYWQHYSIVTTWINELQKKARHWLPLSEMKHILFCWLFLSMLHLAVICKKQYIRLTV